MGIDTNTYIAIRTLFSAGISIGDRDRSAGGGAILVNRAIVRMISTRRRSACSIYSGEEVDGGRGRDGGGTGEGESGGSMTRDLMSLCSI
jgi:hypothetical protein